MEMHIMHELLPYRAHGNDVSRYDLSPVTKTMIGILRNVRADVFANIHNEHVSEVFACNNNVVAAVDGGSPMYLTAYHCKNTQKEDNDQFAKAAKAMIRKMNERFQLEQTRVDEHDIDEDDNTPDAYSTGLKTMIGAVIHATNAHTCVV